MSRRDPRIKTSADKIAERVFNEAAKLPTPELVRAVVALLVYAGAQVNDTDPMRAVDAMRKAASRRFDDMLSGKLPGMTETIQ